MFPYLDHKIYMMDLSAGNLIRIINNKTNEMTFSIAIFLMMKHHITRKRTHFLSHKNAFPIKLIDSCIKNFLNKRLTEKPVTLAAEKKDLVIALPFLGKLSLDLRTRLRNSISKNIPFCKIRVIFKSSTRISNFFQFKDKMPYCLRSNVVYKFSCGRCNATYYGETCRHLSVRVGEHSGVSPLTGKKSKSKNSTAVKDHMLLYDHTVSIDDFKILATSDSDFHVKVKENLLISRDEPILNKNETSLPLHLFD